VLYLNVINDNRHAFSPNTHLNDRDFGINNQETVLGYISRLFATTKRSIADYFLPHGFNINASLANPCQKKHLLRWHKLRRFIACKTKHHSLVEQRTLSKS
jgi:hypothetical protein